MVKRVDTVDEFRALKKCKDYCIFYFTASWCGPCQKISPVFDSLAEECASDHLKFYKIDVDDNPAAAEEGRVEKMPTFQVYDDKSNLVYVMCGANEQNLRKLVNLVDQRQKGVLVDDDF